MGEFRPDSAESVSERRLSESKQQLNEYGLEGLEGRMEHGLDPAAMLALEETRSAAVEAAGKIGAKMEELDELTKDLHVGGIWKHAEELGKAEKPEVVMWLGLAHECQEKNEADELLDEAGFLADLDRVIEGLKGYAEDPDRLQEAAGAETRSAAEKFELIDGVAYSEEADPFLSMAIAGQQVGVAKAGELYFVAADSLDFDSLAADGLEREEREDRGRRAVFWTREGQDVIKQLYPGFGIVLNGDREQALELARRSQPATEAESREEAPE